MVLRKILRSNSLQKLFEVDFLMGLRKILRSGCESNLLCGVGGRRNLGDQKYSCAKAPEPHFSKKIATLSCLAQIKKTANYRRSCLPAEE